jgi:hypothetical protein
VKRDGLLDRWNVRLGPAQGESAAAPAMPDLAASPRNVSIEQRTASIRLKALVQTGCLKLLSAPPLESLERYD